MGSKGITIRFLGTGDAFGSGGRLQSSILVDSSEGSFLVDCGASTLIGLKRLGFDSSSVRAVFISHLHADHFSGLPFIIKEIQVTGGRQEPLAVAGPPGLESHVTDAVRLFFPGPEDPQAVFWPEFTVLPTDRSTEAGGLSVRAYPAVHSAAAHPLSLRIECCGRVIAYSGDTEWNENIPMLCQGADIFICECFQYERETGNHLDYITLMEHCPELGCERIILTHLGDTMLERCSSLELQCADDGMRIDI